MRFFKYRIDWGEKEEKANEIFKTLVTPVTFFVILLFSFVSSYSSSYDLLFQKIPFRTNDSQSLNKTLLNFMEAKKGLIRAPLLNLFPLPLAFFVYILSFGFKSRNSYYLKLLGSYLLFSVVLLVSSILIVSGTYGFLKITEIIGLGEWLTIGMVLPLIPFLVLDYKLTKLDFLSFLR